MLGNYIETHSVGAVFEIWFPKEVLTKYNTGVAFLKCLLSVPQNLSMAQ